ncbi:CAP domain-containing protein [Sungkyunkwania multivorans]|uniref:CAP domain-containing protein n=1 Tax=Sungkyunkwania multivorans TaxID=1173618 RepID=A0ABW3D1Y7_9FLAO
MRSPAHLFKYILLILMFASCSSESTEEEIQLQQLPSANTVESEILQLVNQHRQSIGKSVLTKNNLAEELARDHTLYMISQNDISHEYFDQRAEQLQREANAYGVGENVAAGQPSAQSVMTAWLNSSGHKANIEGNYTHIGISAIKNDQGVYYYTQLFLRK